MNCLNALTSPHFYTDVIKIYIWDIHPVHIFKHKYNISWVVLITDTYMQLLFTSPLSILRWQAFNSFIKK